jgi:hypothetical protein
MSVETLNSIETFQLKIADGITYGEDEMAGKKYEIFKNTSYLIVKIVDSHGNDLLNVKLHLEKSKIEICKNFLTKLGIPIPVDFNLYFPQD